MTKLRNSGNYTGRSDRSIFRRTKRAQPYIVFWRCLSISRFGWGRKEPRGDIRVIEDSV